MTSLQSEFEYQFSDKTLKQFVSVIHNYLDASSHKLPFDLYTVPDEIETYKIFKRKDDEISTDSDDLQYYDDGSDNSRRRRLTRIALNYNKKKVINLRKKLLPKIKFGHSLISITVHSFLAFIDQV